MYKVLAKKNETDNNYYYKLERENETDNFYNINNTSYKYKKIILKKVQKV